MATNLQIIDTLGKWKDDFVGLVKDYGTHISSLQTIRVELETAKKFYEDSTKKWWVEYKYLIFPTGIMALTIAAFWALGKIANSQGWCEVSFAMDKGFSFKKCAEWCSSLTTK
jgi:hypothetical protein